MKQTRIAVLVSGGGTNLQALIDAQGRGELGGGKIVAVISSKEGAYALERAAKAGIEGYLLKIVRIRDGKSKDSCACFRRRHQFAGADRCAEKRCDRIR
jgi:folate-dependent phosphoribosylglycinamide formyltransferase PurN